MDIYAELGVRPIINAAGTLTTLSGSLLRPEVADAMAAASRAFVVMEELHLAAGRRIAELVGVEAAHVCLCSAAGISLMAAACMTGPDRRIAEQLPDTRGLKNRFLVQPAHRNPFDRALLLTGAQFVEVEPEESAIRRALGRDDVAGVYYTSAWFCPGQALPLAQVAALAHAAGVPVVVDAAAEVPPAANLRRFLEEGADLVVFSGGKAIRGPQSSGLILGRADLIEACRGNDAPYTGVVGRPMKAGKEEIVGLVKAVELYVARDHAVDLAIWEQRVAHVIGALADLEHVEAERLFPWGAVDIPQACIRWDEAALGLTHKDAHQQLLDGEPRIALRLVTPQIYHWNAQARTELRMLPHNLQTGEEIIVARRLRELLGAGANRS